MTIAIVTWCISAIAMAGVIVRPFRWPEAVWAVAGAGTLVLLGLVTPEMALEGIAKGTDVYLFLAGMMLLSETAREAGLFDWLAMQAARRARGSPKRLFLLVYVVGIVVTVFLSNDATAVVLTPAVAAAVRGIRLRNPLPYLLICAFTANAASFVLPISNPANLVMHASRMPPLVQWLRQYGPAAVVAVLATYACLRWVVRDSLGDETMNEPVHAALSRSGRIAAAGIVLAALVLLTASAFELQLGPPTAICGGLTLVLGWMTGGVSPGKALRGISWSVLPLVAGLFVLVEALDKTGVIRWLATVLAEGAAASVPATSVAAGLAVALASNLVNNLPAGLVAASAAHAAQSPEPVIRALVIGVDLGPNLSVTGSLATILWLAALRRDGHHVNGWQFLKIGAVVMVPALVLSLVTAIALG
jgi:arsenical pump membrane protein